MKKKFKKYLNLSLMDIYILWRNGRVEKEQKISTNRIFREYLATTTLPKLQIGCGNNYLEGWLNTDINGIPGIGYLDASKPFSFKDKTFNYIYSEHLFEHLTAVQQLNMLSESHRVLKTGGILRIATPSLEFLFSIYKAPLDKENRDYVSWAVNTSPYLNDIKNNIEDKGQHYCYVINNFFKAWGHQMIHNFSSLEKMGLQLGYSKVRRCEVGHSDALDLQNIEKHGEVIPAEINLVETMVVELVK